MSQSPTPDSLEAIATDLIRSCPSAVQLAALIIVLDKLRAIAKARLQDLRKPGA